MKTVTYLYDEKAPDGLAVFQDMTTQIRGFSFKQSQLGKVKSLNHAENAGIYFLFSEDDEIKKVYIGQSVNGVSRIQHHISGKLFWQRCLLFVTDNASFSKTTIDYLEYHFIRFFDKSDYILENKDLRDKEPNVNDFERPALEESARQIEFLLACQGIKKQETTFKKQGKVYKAAGKNNAWLVVHDGEFILLQGSHIAYPNLESKQWQNNQTGYDNRMTQIKQFIEQGKLEQIEDSKAKLLMNINFKSPSGAGDFVTGNSVNGWDFWQGLKHDREKIQKNNIKVSKPKDPYLYIFRCGDDSYHAGYSINFDNSVSRIILTEEGIGIRNIRGKIPVKLVYFGRDVLAARISRSLNTDDNEKQIEEFIQQQESQLWNKLQTAMDQLRADQTFQKNLLKRKDKLLRATQ